MPIRGIMFRPKYHGGAKYAQLFKCMGCNNDIHEIPFEDRSIFELKDEPEDSEKRNIIFYRCDCGTVNWVHGRTSSIDLYTEVPKLDFIPAWAEGDPQQGEIDYTPRLVDSRTMLPYGETEASLEKIRKALQALLQNPEWKPYVLAHNLKAKDEEMGLVDRYLNEHWFMVEGDKVRGTWAK